MSEKTSDFDPEFIREWRSDLKRHLGISCLTNRKYITADAVCDAFQNRGTRIELGSGVPVRKRYLADLKQQAQQIDQRLVVTSKMAVWDSLRYDHRMIAYLEVVEPKTSPSDVKPAHAQPKTSDSVVRDSLSEITDSVPLKELAVGRLKLLEGTTFELPQRYFPYHGDYKHIRAHEFLELKVGEVLSEVYSEKAKREPNGGNTFPDYSVGEDTFEVKTSKSRNKRFMVGTVSKIAEAFADEDPKYLEASYLVFYHDYEEGDTSFTLNEVHVGSIYDFSAARKGSGSKIEYPSSRTSLGPESWASNFLWSMDFYSHSVVRENVQRTFEKVGLKVLTGA